MIGNLDETIESLLATALPDLFGGATPAVALTIRQKLLAIDVLSAENLPGEPRPGDRIDNFPFDPANPPASFTLTQPPYPGPRRVRLTTAPGDRIPLRESEVAWDETDGRIFSLNLAATHDLAGVNGVQVLYGVTAVFTTLKAVQSFTLELQSSDSARLEQAEALAAGLLELNRQALLNDATAVYESGEYSAAVSVKGLRLVEGPAAPAADQRHLTYNAEVELKAGRALREDEGRPIVRIRTPGQPLDPDRPVDIHIIVDA
jgi:hypothetical protein